MIYQPSFQVVTLHLTFSSTGYEPAETQTLLGVVSSRNLRLEIFLGKLNNVDIWGADFGNAYLEAFTDEKLFIVAGPEFHKLEGYILIFQRHSID